MADETMHFHRSGHGFVFGVALGALLLWFAGCSGVVESEFVRVDEGATLAVLRPPKPGGRTMTTVVLPKRAVIRKVVVVPRQLLQDFDLRVRTDPHTWETVKTVEGRFKMPVTIRVDVEGDAVRIVERAPALRTRFSASVAGGTGTIETILVYGLPLPESEATP